jgi:hypothetical protein
MRREDVEQRIRVTMTRPRAGRDGGVDVNDR